MNPLPLQETEFLPSANKLLATLPDDELQRIVSHLARDPLKFKQSLYKHGEPIHDVYFPGGGACSLTKTMENGSTAEMATIGNEGLLGASVLFGDDRSNGDAIVQVEGAAGYRMPVAAFLAEMARHGLFYNRVIRYHQALLGQVMQTTACNALHSAEQRCCRWLLMTHDRVGGDELKLTHEFLAVMLGVRRPTATLIVRTLRTAGLIDVRRGTIHIADRTGLEARSCECYATVQRTFARLLPEIPGPTG